MSLPGMLLSNVLPRSGVSMGWLASVHPSMDAMAFVRSVPAVSSGRVGTLPSSATFSSHRTRVTPRRLYFLTCKACCPIPGRQPNVQWWDGPAPRRRVGEPAHPETRVASAQCLRGEARPAQRCRTPNRALITILRPTERLCAHGRHFQTNGRRQSLYRPLRPPGGTAHT